MTRTFPRQRLAVIGAGVSGLSCAWALSCNHDVVLYEAEGRLGGHANTREVEWGGRTIPVDTGFIVYNEPTYPNLRALFAHLGVETAPTDMSFAVSLDQGALEYAGKDLRGLFAQPSNIFSARFWSMIRDLLRFYREAPCDLSRLGDISLDDYLARGFYGEAFIHDHLYPMAAAIWSTPAGEVGAFPAAAFIRFCENHGLLKLVGRPTWRTIRGGSRAYVGRLAEAIPEIRAGAAVRKVVRFRDCVEIRDARGADRFDQVVIAAHADAALAMLEQPSDAERRLLGAFRYASNVAWLHSDASLMPRRKAAWAAWNYLAERDGDRSLAVTYWMNRLQPLGEAPQLFVTLNPPPPPRADLIHAQEIYRHPQFDLAAMAAQKELWSLQGADRIWYCGAYFGSGFHEDGLQAGLAVAEQLGGAKRPWRVEKESGRIFLTSKSPPERELAPA
ncbi:FAD-dependent oxidoreductase [Rhodoblastus acidophilus]|uniref:FAD-dependent oxidoreductase n=1 Tax=Candidatus Rhodoblastus alkanivorans TaxID=2954117 RepID=A0ABS9Z7L7_9HYPH|nr:FAD-dependent oxidoreductase [Candidatus Rhodoblastus alkanivorans]MCI4678356.1 FAD-dependent oxidoreductase [Candidatus Rhodoblastus alkanivorans]MCI4683614.1 FAD-dependent oxidoreductase [Candidatus Rhodoblastus alkanivorans]MDI4640930.1 FAD-dependent oxidoreductase [Rhodoblastus acidophilus]